MQKPPLKRWELPLLALVLAGYWLTTIWAVTNKSMTQDEGIHLVAGYSYWEYNDYRLQPENGNLPQRLGGLLASLSDINFVSLEHPWWVQAEQFRLAPFVIFGLGNEGEWMLFKARSLMAIMGVLLVAGIWWWSRSLWGPLGGLISAVFAAASPNLLANGPLITSDTFFSAALLFMCISLWACMNRMTVSRVLIFYFLAGILCLSKFSAVVIVPIAAIFLLVRTFAGPNPRVIWKGRTIYQASTCLNRFGLLLGMLIVGVVAAYAIIWAGFGFRYDAFNTGPGQFPTDLTNYASPGDPVFDVLLTLHDYRLFPESYIQGFGDTYFKSRERAAYFLGENGNGGWRLFFVISFLVKTPVSTLISLLLAIFLPLAVWWHKRALNVSAEAYGWIYRLTPVIVPMIVYYCMALSSNLNIGHRHILPVYGFLFVLLGVNRFWLTGIQHYKSRLMAGAFCLLLVSNVVSSARNYPHYISYFNALAGGPSNGRFFLIDSSLDWGQDMPLLGEWIREYTKNEPIYTLLFSASPPDYYGIDSTVLFGYGGNNYTLDMPKMEPGYYAISATILMGPYIDVYGPWNEGKELAYQRLNALMLKLLDEVETEEEMGLYLYANPGNDWPKEFLTFYHLRLHRLRLAMFQKTPEFVLGNTIYIYRLSDADLKEAGLQDCAGFPPTIDAATGFQVYRQLLIQESHGLRKP